MSEINDRLDTMILEANMLKNELRMLALMLDACPRCHVARAGMIRELDALAGKMVDVAVGIRLLKEADVGTGAASGAPTGNGAMTKEAADDEPE